MKKNFEALYARFLNSKGGRHRRMEDEDEEVRVCVSVCGWVV